MVIGEKSLSVELSKSSLGAGSAHEWSGAKTKTVKTSHVCSFIYKYYRWNLKYFPWGSTILSGIGKYNIQYCDYNDFKISIFDS